MSNFFESKVVVEREGKTVNEIYVVKSDEFIVAEASVSADLGTQFVKTTQLSEKPFTDVFDDSTKEHFYELKTESIDVDGKIMKETYLQKADSTKDAETLLLDNINNEPEITSNKVTKIVDYIIG